MCCLYVLLNKEGNRTYTGITDNLDKRIVQHNKGHSKFTSKFGPWRLIYFEIINNRTDARKKEKYFKSAAGRRWMKINIFE